ncbi:MAG: right-handed parallel beta-helix repeat-containing protein, partial [Planctomycetaceae bacterium]|nr:right-handed parallel beta-helix repeat-containing protein [Planctomycetaceae bacterium]
MKVSFSKAVRTRQLRFEPLEERQLLAVSATEFSQIRTQYPDLNLSANMADYNVIEITAAQLTATNLQNAINTAGATTANDLIVCRTTSSQNTIALNSALTISSNSTIWGSVNIVSLGMNGFADNLTLDAQAKSRVFSIGSTSTVALAGLTITGGYSSSGGGIYNSGKLTITDSAIAENSAEQLGGGIYNSNKLTVTNCTITGNSATSTGGGIYNSGELTITSCTIAENTAKSYYGGGIYNNNNLTVTNCTITGNSASSGGGIFSWGGDLTLNNTIVVENFGYYDIYPWNKATVRGSNNLTTFTAWDSGTNNLVYDSAKRLFVNSFDGDYRLVPGSQAIDKGSNALLPGELSHDLAGNPRIVNGIVDMGAYEHDGSPVMPPLIVEVSAKGILRILGTEEADWIEIQETATQIIVHSSNATGTTELKQWPFEKNTISTIEFHGYGGNDTFKNAYKGVSCSIACRLDGGYGNNTLVGGMGNDWIYSGPGGTNILDTGPGGDNIVIGGYGNNTYYNNSSGSTAFAWIGSTTNNKWADEKKKLGPNDAQLIFSPTFKNGRTQGKYGCVARPWLEDEVVNTMNTLSDFYKVIGNYKILGSPYFNGITYVMASDLGDASYTNFINGETCLLGGNFAAVHEFAHLWNDTHINPVFKVFWDTTWEDDGVTLKSGKSLEQDTTNNYSGKMDVFEDWAQIVQSIVLGNQETDCEGKPDLRKKFDIVHQFFDWLALPREALSTVVTTNLDVVDATDGLISLREAINYAQPGDTITFDASMKGKTITLNEEALSIDKSISIDATGRNITIDGDKKSGVFEVFDDWGDRLEVALMGLAITGGSYGWGGGIYNERSALTVINCTISGNTSQAGAIYNLGGALTIINCTISGNDGGGIYNINLVSGGQPFNATATLYNTIVAQQKTGVDISKVGTIQIQGNNNLTSFTGWSSGTANLVYNPALPLFVNATAGDYRLAASSQAIDKGNNAYTIAAGVTTDLAGKSRIVGGTVDMGAFEYQSAPLTPANVTATAVSTKTVLLTWDAVASAESYKVYCYDSTVAGGWRLLANVAGTSWT